MGELTIWQALFDLVLWATIFVTLRPAYKFPFRLKKRSRYLGILLMVVFCLFPFWAGDYFHSIESYTLIKQGGYSRFEDVYVWIIENIAPSYHFFRLVVWGSGLTLLFLAYKRIGHNFDMSLFFFGALYLPLFSYARASLAMSIIIFGITFLCKPVRNLKILSIALGATIVLCSFFFHRTAVVGIFSVFMATLLIDNNKWKTILLIILVPLGIYGLSMLLDSIMMIDFDSVDEVLNRKRDTYLSGDVAVKGIARQLSDFLTRTPMFLSAILYIVLVTKGYYKKMPTVERAIASYVFSIMILALGFSLNLGYNTTVLYYRTINYALPANAIFLMSIKSRNIEQKYFKIIYYMALAAAGYSLLYSTYMGYNRM